jgi:lipopolysaccharide export system permease protein
VESFNSEFNQGFRFSMEKLDKGQLKFRLASDAIHWDSIYNRWKLINYSYREIDGLNEKLILGAQLDTVKSFTYKDFYKKNEFTEMMNYFELNEFIRQEKTKGSGVYQFYEVEKYKRFAMPFANIILTLIAVAISSRKVRGGIGMHIALGFALSFTYILFMQVSSTFATNGSMPAIIAVWIPNIIYAIIGLVLLRRAPK